MAKVLIIGASRGIGLEAVKQALAAGHSVRAMARSARRIPVTHDRLEKVAGDALDREAVRDALQDQDAVIQALGVSPSPPMLLEPVRLFSDATRILIDAMHQMGVKRLICLTGFGAGDSRYYGNFLYRTAFTLFLGRVYDDKTVQERLVRESDLDWVIARPTILTNGPKTGTYKVLTDPKDWRCGFISRADVADFLVKQITLDRYLRQTPVLTR
jgi:putative NADH-flavin reductase